MPSPLVLVREALSRLSLVLLGLLLTILLGEVAARLFGGGQATLVRGMFFAVDPKAGKRCLPNADMRFVLPGSFDARVQCNSQGLRDREHSLARKPGIRRILVLGDSFAWGYGVENDEMFSTRLERDLPGTETINFGVTGYSAVQELARLDPEGFSYSPDWTVVLFCDNDLEGDFASKGSSRPYVELRGDGILHIENPVHESVWAPVGGWINLHSRLFVEIYYRFMLLKERMNEWRTASRDHGPAPAPSPDQAGATEQAAIQERAALRNGDMDLSLIDRFVDRDPRVDQAWATLEQVYALMRDEIARHGGRMLVAYVAETALTLPETFQALVAQSGISPGRVDWDRPGASFEKMCADLAIPCVNLASGFRKAPDPNTLFLQNNGHWSARGHGLAARIVARRLRELDPSLR